MYDFVTTNKDNAKRIPVWVENHVKQYALRWEVKKSYSKTRDDLYVHQIC
ncbi:7976_t:CDS:1 [Ambispora leptoticha]|uniref:7976_t:CDS:1 n=1 Tax=Ambispora leptoticha TaxID=144679 RepID=A0A9N9N643_9GLOM|nr:7976_t:CDS:1 [Ambispora leptoticha]